MITTASQNQPKKPASRFGFPTPRLPVSLTDLAFFVEACFTSVMSHPFQLACGLVAAAEPLHPEGHAEAQNHEEHRDHAGGAHLVGPEATDVHCLLYTSDAADEEDSVDLGGRRIITK